MPDLVPIRRALISVSDKTGVEAFARALASLGVQIISTGGTAKLLQAAGVPVTTIDAVTGFPEMMDGRLKTLHPKVHGGLLGLRDDPHHAAAMREQGIEPIDLVCVNLYPFEATIAKAGVTRDEAIEQIDIGGPAMLRSGSKNHAFVTVVTDPSQYDAVIAEIRTGGGGTSLATRAHLAQRAFETTSRYDTSIAAYLAGRGALESEPAPTTPVPTTLTATAGATGTFPDTLQLRFAKLGDLRHGENPHQLAAVYVDPLYAGPSVVAARQLHGKQLSYNNLHDAAAALELAMALSTMSTGVAACCIKHANPCGAAVASDARTALDHTIAGDPLAAFGGIIALAARLDRGGAERLCQQDVFLEVMVAEGYDDDALAALKARWQNLRILATGPLADAPTLGRTFKPLRGGLLTQEADELAPAPDAWTLKAGPAPTPAVLKAAASLEVVVRAMASNAVALGTPTDVGVMLVGGGLGQVDRVTACQIAVEKAGPRAQGAIAFSDAFFPFPDGPKRLIDAGVRTIIHPGGSKRDGETYELCERHGVSCLITGVRRFRH